MNLEEVKEHFKNAKTVIDLAVIENSGEVEIDHPLRLYDYNNGDVWINPTEEDVCIKIYDADTDTLSPIIEELPRVKYTNTELKEIQKPKHYDTGGIDVIDFCKAYDLNFNLGNVCKYVARAGKKDSAIQDLEKALDYINRELNHLKK